MAKNKGRALGGTPLQGREQEGHAEANAFGPGRMTDPWNADRCDFVI
jgi:hypothetical protein